METTVHYDETAPRRERWRALRQCGPNRWITVESFGREGEAHAFARGLALGAAFGDVELQSHAA